MAQIVHRFYTVCSIVCSCLRDVIDVFQVLVVVPGTASYSMLLIQESEELLRVRGSILNVVERMDEEYIKMLQSCDAHSTEYVDRCVTACRTKFVLVQLLALLTATLTLLMRAAVADCVTSRQCAH